MTIGQADIGVTGIEALVHRLQARYILAFLVTGVSGVNRSVRSMPQHKLDFIRGLAFRPEVPHP
jgi:hypothetical protein